MSEALVTPGLSRDEARSLTDEVKNDAERLWRKLVELYEGGAHRVLGYTSWAAYFQDEFGGSRSRAYQILDAGRVARHLQSTMVDSPAPTERQARELRSLLSQPEKLQDAWEEATETTDNPTASAVREIVTEKLAPMSNKAVMNANAEARRIYKALASVDGFCSALDEIRIDRVLTVATDEDLAAWESLAAGAISALNRLRRNLKEER